MRYSLSPCVQSAVSSLPNETTAWALAKHLHEMHPEYTKNKMINLIDHIDNQYQGSIENVSDILEKISQRYPSESLLHTKLVMLGLYHLDPNLQQVIPKEVMKLIQEDLGLE